MLQEIFRFHIFGHTIPIYGYGLMLVVAFLACVQLAKFLARRSSIDPELFVNAALIALIAGVIGARASHVIENWPEYTNPHFTLAQNVANMLNIREGGLTFYGGFLLATPCCIAYAMWKKVPVLLGMDIVAPCLVLGLGIGRIGCFLNGCCYGELTSVPWAVQFPYASNAYVEQFQEGRINPPPELLKETPTGKRLLTWDEIRGHANLESLARQQKALAVHPTEIYSTITAFIICGLLVCFFTLPHADGQVFALMCIIEGMTRFILEMIRVEPAVVTKVFGINLDWSLSMVLGAILVVVGIILWFVFAKVGPVRQNPDSYPQAAIAA